MWAQCSHLHSQFGTHGFSTLPFFLTSHCNLTARIPLQAAFEPIQFPTAQATERKEEQKVDGYRRNSPNYNGNPKGTRAAEHSLNQTRGNRSGSSSQTGLYQPIKPTERNFGNSQKPPQIQE